MTRPPIRPVLAIAAVATVTALTAALGGCTLPSVATDGGIDNPEHHRGLVSNQKLSPDSGQGNSDGGWSGPAR